MSLSNKQFLFSKNVGQLLNFIHFKGWKTTLGEVYRPEEMQEIYAESGKSQTLDSLHQKKLAIDINFFKPKEGIPVLTPDGKSRANYTGWKLTYKKKDLQEFGDYWEFLSPYNEWGGNWKDFIDSNHFQRNENKKR